MTTFDRALRVIAWGWIGISVAWLFIVGVLIALGVFR